MRIFGCSIVTDFKSMMCEFLTNFGCCVIIFNLIVFVALSGLNTFVVNLITNDSKSCFF